MITKIKIINDFLKSMGHSVEVRLDPFYGPIFACCNCGNFFFCQEFEERIEVYYQNNNRFTQTYCYDTKQCENISSCKELIIKDIIT